MFLKKKLNNHVSLNFLYLKKPINLQKKSNRLRVGFGNYSGICYHSGKRVLWSKGSRKNTKTYFIINNSFFGFFVATLLVWWGKVNGVQNKKIFGLFCNSLGMWFHQLLPTSIQPFSFTRIAVLNKSIFINMGDPAHFLWPTSLSKLEPHCKICLISSLKFNSIKLVRSPGSRCLLLTPRFMVKWSLLWLPSGQFKILPAQSTYAHLGAVQFDTQRKFKIYKAGYNINLGRKPTVRGTVKNANDHPNGGRSRALRLPLTPWGFPTKKPRH